MGFGWGYDGFVLPTRASRFKSGSAGTATNSRDVRRPREEGVWGRNSSRPVATPFTSTNRSTTGHSMRRPPTVPMSLNSISTPSSVEALDFRMQVGNGGEDLPERTFARLQAARSGPKWLSQHDVRRQEAVQTIHRRCAPESRKRIDELLRGPHSRPRVYYARAAPSGRSPTFGRVPDVLRRSPRLSQRR